MTVLQFKPRAKVAPVQAPVMTTTFTTPSQFARNWAYVSISILVAPWMFWLDVINAEDNAELRRRGGA